MKIALWTNNRKIVSARGLLLIVVFLGVSFGSVRDASAQLSWNTLSASNNLAIAATSVQFEYFITNTGPRAVKLTGVRYDCGDITALFPTNAVEPGSVGRVEVQLNVENEEGLIQKSVELTTD